MTKAEREQGQENEEKERVEVKVESTSIELEELKKELEEKAALADEYLSRLKYLQADFENYKKMVARERESYEICATGELIKRLLPIIDTFEAAIALAKQESSNLTSFVEGIELLYNDLMSALEKEGLKPIKSVGEKFDPYRHEVVMASVDKALPEGTILEELEKGYMLGSKVIRTAKIKISKGAEEPPQSTIQENKGEDY